MNPSKKGEFFIETKMDFKRITSVILICGVLLTFLDKVTAGDIVHDDELAPKKPGCENDFVLVYFLS